MTAENDLRDILLPGETMVWSGRPDWQNAEKPATGWRSKSGAIKFAAIMLLVFIVMMAWGAIFDPRGFASGILGVLIVIAALAFVIAVMNILDRQPSAIIRHDHLYAITDRRLIIHDVSKLTTRSITGPIIYEVQSVENGDVKDLNIRYSHSEDGIATFYALKDVVAPQKLLLEQFSFRKVST
ncbi:MAG: hypothetical protein VX640_06755 [Pseudomonadota bacterium]|nr:hypothetical protein [Pseudomonadota bacterium]